MDPPPHVLVDEIDCELTGLGARLAQPGDMDPQFMRPFRASIVGRARFIEDLVTKRAAR